MAHTATQRRLALVESDIRAYRHFLDVLRSAPGTRTRAQMAEIEAALVQLRAERRELEDAQEARRPWYDPLAEDA